MGEQIRNLEKQIRGLEKQNRHLDHCITWHKHNNLVRVVELQKANKGIARLKRKVERLKTHPCTACEALEEK